MDWPASSLGVSICGSSLRKETKTEEMGMGLGVVGVD